MDKKKLHQYLVILAICILTVMFILQLIIEAMILGAILLGLQKWYLSKQKD